MSGDPASELRAYIEERWAVIRRHEPRFHDCTELHVRFEDLTCREAGWFMASVHPHDGEPPLFTVEDDNKHPSDRCPPNADGSRRGNVFFEEAGGRCSLRLETLVHDGATWRLHDEFGWPRTHLIVESPDLVDETEQPLLRREALDILLLEQPCAPLPSRMPIRTAASRVGVEAKADKAGLDRLLDQMRECGAGRIGSGDQRRHKDAHKKCVALDVLRPRFFLGVAAGEDWRLFKVEERAGRAVLGERVGLDLLQF